MTTVDVLVVGAGPTGLMLAGWLVRHGVKVAVLDAKSGVVPESRALAVHARTLETYDQLGIGEDARARGRVGERINIWVRRQRKAVLDLTRMGEGQSPHPYVFVISQNENEQVLYAHLQRHGGEVRWETRLLTLKEEGRRAVATVQGPAGEEKIAASYVCGCDGASSAVRHALGLAFPGGTYAENFYVADVEAHGGVVPGELNACLDYGSFQLVFPMPGENRARLIGIMPKKGKEVRFEDIREEVTRPFGIEVTDVKWFSAYKVHHRMASHFRLGRCFLVGDAAHVHSPVGGQGMNTGLMDAANLGWKLAAVIKRGASERLLDTYAEERMPFARRLVHTTDRAFTFITSRAPWAPFLRVVLLPNLLRLVGRTEWIKRVAFRIISQTSISYRGSWSSRNHAPSSGVKAGDRLPWVGQEGTADNFAPLQSCDWQIHVYGKAEAALGAWYGLPVHSFPYGVAARRAGLRKGATYVVRPDGYIGMISQPFDSATVDRYLREVGALAGH